MARDRRAGRAGAARLFLALFPRRPRLARPRRVVAAPGDGGDLLPLLVLAAAAAVLARQPGGIKAGFDRLGQGGAATGGAIGAAPTPPASAAVAPLSAPGSSAAPTAAVPVATLFAQDASLQAGMVRLTDAAGVARVQGAEGDERRVVAVGDTAYVLNLGPASSRPGARRRSCRSCTGRDRSADSRSAISWTWPGCRRPGRRRAGGGARRARPVVGAGRRRGAAAAGDRRAGARDARDRRYDGGLYGPRRRERRHALRGGARPVVRRRSRGWRRAADVATALDIAIDGSVFVLLAGGEIRR
ncbi:MAG: hypothetical protein U0470_02650 [Anaerolineae bacterium]